MLTRALSALVLAALTLLFAGCAGPPTESAPQSEPASDTQTHRDVMREIRDVAGLPMDHHVRDGLVHIAKRPGVSPEAQVMLIETALDELMLDSRIMDVLNALLDNPDVHPVALDRMQAAMDTFDFQITREKLSQRIKTRRDDPAGANQPEASPPEANGN